MTRCARYPANAVPGNSGAVLEIQVATFEEVGEALHNDHQICQVDTSIAEEKRGISTVRRKAKPVRLPIGIVHLRYERFRSTQADCVFSTTFPNDDHELAPE